jgi:hypothetical protein
VSLHSVKASAQTRTLFDHMAATHGAAWIAISVDVHSCTLSPEVWRDIEVRLFLHPRLSPLASPPLMGGTETPPECIFITLDGYQWPLTGSYCAHPCMCSQSDSCRIGLPRCVRRTGADVGHGMYSGGNARVADRGRMGRWTRARRVAVGRCPAARGELACIPQWWASPADEKTDGTRAA